MKYQLHPKSTKIDAFRQKKHTYVTSLFMIATVAATLKVTRTVGQVNGYTTLLTMFDVTKEKSIQLDIDS